MSRSQAIVERAPEVTVQRLEEVMHVSRLQISGVRGFHGARSVDLDLTRPDGSMAGWTVLAGRNGSGKSTVLQALALALAGPRSTSFIPSLADWMSVGVSTAEIRAFLSPSDSDPRELTLLDSAVIQPEVWINFTRTPQGELGQIGAEPDFSGMGLDAFNQGQAVSSVRSPSSGWFYAGYGAFRHLGSSGSLRPGKSRFSKLAQQVSSLFDETVPLTDAVDWLIEQHLYELEKRIGAADLLRVAMTLLGDGLLPDGFRVSRVDSEGLWVSHGSAAFPLREMSDGYRAVTALVVDIIRQMTAAYPNPEIEYRQDVPTLPYPGVILIDEVDDHLHVRWQKTIGTWLKTHFPQIQFIVTTHSPYVCQSADPGGLILLPGPGENRAPRVIEQDMYERVVYGSGDDAILTELFGIDTPYSAEAERLRQRLGDLEVKVLEGSATVAERGEFQKLTEKLTSSMSARVDEVAARFGRDR
jgi:energy-coupling factor transporter ATP-binding protein EcfA2